MSDMTPEYVAKVISAAPFADNEAGIPQMVELIRAQTAEITRLRAQLAEARDKALEEAAVAAVRYLTDSATLGSRLDLAIADFANDTTLSAEVVGAVIRNLKGSTP